MQKDRRILDKILTLKRHPEDNWSEELDKVNIWHMVQPLYKEIEDRRTANIILAFIVLAYDASSDYLQITKDRLMDKRSIMMRLAGESCFDKEIFLQAVLGDDGGPIDSTIEWYIDQQKDWRWQTIVTGIEFHSRAQALSKGADSLKDMHSAGSTLNVAEERREKADRYLDNIRTEFADLDTALEKEDRVKVSERLSNDPTVWEMFIKRRNHKVAREEAERKAEEAERKAKKEKAATDDNDDPDSPF
jgi:hypothetical protein